MNGTETQRPTHLAVGIELAALAAAAVVAVLGNALIALLVWSVQAGRVAGGAVTNRPHSPGASPNPAGNHPASDYVGVVLLPPKVERKQIVAPAPRTPAKLMLENMPRKAVRYLVEYCAEFMGDKPDCNVSLVAAVSDEVYGSSNAPVLIGVTILPPEPAPTPAAKRR